MYWAQALAAQTKDADLQKTFAPIAEEMVNKEDAIVKELNDAQGSKVNIDGYYITVFEKTSAAMRTSKTLNTILESINMLYYLFFKHVIYAYGDSERLL